MSVANSPLQLPLFPLDKTCRLCGTAKPLEDFVVEKRSPTGYATWCKACAQLRASRWYEQNKDYASKRDREKRLLYRDTINAKRRGHIKTPEQLAQARERWQRFYESHKDIHKERCNDWIRRNPLKRRESAERRRARELSAEGNFTTDDVNRIFEEQGGLCAYCRRSIADGFHIDHAIPLSRGGSNWPSNLRLACQPCNQSKFTKTDAEFMAYLAKRGVAVG